MKIIDPRREHPPFDIPAGQWPLYKSQGYHQFVEVDTTPQIEVRWSTQRGRFVDDYEAPPIITWSATNGTNGYCESQVGTAHKTVKVYIPGQKPVTCPSHVGQQYETLFAEWAAKRKKKTQPAREQVSASTPKIPGVSPYSGSTKQPWAQI